MKGEGEGMKILKLCGLGVYSGMPLPRNNRNPDFKIGKLYRWSVLSALLLCLTIVPGCYNRQSNAPPSPLSPQSQSPASTPPAASAPRPMYYDFPDIPVPAELTRLDKGTFVFQSGPFKAGLLTLRGIRVDLKSLISFFQMAMVRENWKPKGGFHSERTVLIFEKPDKTCVINLYENLFRTYVEIYVAPVSDQPLSAKPPAGQIQTS